jgi:hypothetical protein
MMGLAGEGKAERQGQNVGDRVEWERTKDAETCGVEKTETVGKQVKRVYWFMTARERANQLTTIGLPASVP